MPAVHSLVEDFRSKNPHYPLPTSIGLISGLFARARDAVASSNSARRGISATLTSQAMRRIIAPFLAIPPSSASLRPDKIKRRPVRLFLDNSTPSDAYCLIRSSARVLPRRLSTTQMMRSLSKPLPLLLLIRFLLFLRIPFSSKVPPSLR